MTVKNIRSYDIKDILSADIVCFMGSSGSGKSTTIRSLIKSLNSRKSTTTYHGLFIGERLRKKFIGTKWNGQLGPEDTVRTMIINKVEDTLGKFHSNYNCIFIDGAPRSIEQVKWLYQKFIHLKIVFVNVDCSLPVSFYRFLKRRRPTDGFWKFFVEYRRNKEVLKFLDSDYRFTLYNLKLYKNAPIS